MSNCFESMTVDEAIEYCNKYKRQYIYDGGDDGEEQFDCLIAIINSGTISPSQLPEYGMEYGDDSLA